MKRAICVFAGILVIAFSIMSQAGGTRTSRESYIKYVEFNVTAEALRTAVAFDIETESDNAHIDCISLLAYLGAKYGGDFSKYSQSDAEDFVQSLKSGESLESLTKNLKFFKYYSEAYTAALGGMVGGYEEEVVDENGDTVTEQGYGVRWFSPIAKTFPFSCYDDFGAQRTYGYSRPHLGHDLMAAVGTPVVAVESGTVECLGWNMYGGWRIGVRSNDGMRYWYYAHLRQNRPYAENLKEGDAVTAGDVIGYVGRTGYSTTENTNGITESHLHIGLELIFDESQKESDNEIWIDLYAITEVLQSHKSAVLRNSETKEFTREFGFKELD